MDSLSPKTIFINFGITHSQFREKFYLDSEIQKYFRVFSLQVLSAKDYFYEFLNTYKFFKLPYSIKDVNINFGDYYRTESKAEEQRLRDLARSFGINKSDPIDILFEWEIKFLEKSTKIGIENYIKLKVFYEVYKKTKDMDLANEIKNMLKINIFEAEDFQVSEDSSTVFLPEKNALSVYVEIVLPKKYFEFLSNFFAKVKEIFNFIARELTISVKVKYIEIIWR